MLDHADRHIDEHLPAFALGCLDADERQLVITHLAQCADCREELQAYEQVVDLIPLAVTEVAPSPSLKTQLLTRVDNNQGKAVALTRVSPRKWLQNLFVPPVWRPISALVVLVLLIVNLFLWQQLNQSRVPGTEILLSPTDTSSNTTGFLYISADGEYGTLIVEELMSLPATQQYQLWLIVNGDQVNGGVFSVSSDGYASLEILSSRPLNEFTAFDITIEPAGGSSAPTGPRVLAHNL